MKGKKRIAILTPVLLVTALAAYSVSRIPGAAAYPAHAARTQSQMSSIAEFACGGFTMGRGQTASIIVVCLTDPTKRDEEPIQAEFSFKDRDGNILTSEAKTLLPGTASSFDINAGQTAGPRNLVLPYVRILGSSDDIANRILATVEVSDAGTGKTQFLINCRKAGGDQAE